MAIRRSHRGNLIVYTTGNTTEIIQISHQWLPHLPQAYGEAQINNENNWSRRVLYLSSPCASETDLHQDLIESNSELQLAAPPRLLTPTVALLFFKRDLDVPQDIYVFATYRKLHEYRHRSVDRKSVV